MRSLCSIITVSSWRYKVTDLWKRDCTYWWIPDEEPPPLILALRNFAERRINGEEIDEKTSIVTNVTGLFEDLKLSED